MSDNRELYKAESMINELTNVLRELQGEKLGLVDSIEDLHKEILAVSTENRKLEKTGRETAKLLDER